MVGLGEGGKKMDQIMLEIFKGMIGAIQQLAMDEYGVMLVLFILALLFQVADVILGTAQAKINNDVKSGKIGDGILKKTSILLMMILIFFVGICLPSIVGTPLIFLVFVWELWNELVSITENLHKMGVDVSFLQPILKSLKVFVESQNEDETEGKK